MDLSKKLAYYTENNRKNTTESNKKESTLPASVLALKAHYNGDILFDEAPVLKISKSTAHPHYTQKYPSLNLISKNEFSEPIDRDKCVFFDLETTGLAGGAGTFAFLIGFAYWQGDHLKSEQFFLPDYGREHALFNALIEFISQFEYIVSYNGKSYDLPLIQNRFILNQVKHRFKKMGHVDLIHMCRRVWKNSLPSCTLKTIEKLLLDVKREGDIPGELIPQAYFDFIYTGRIHDVIRIIDHNYQDIISLALIFDQVGYLHDNPQKVPLDSNAISSLAKLAYMVDMPKYFSLVEESALAEQIDTTYKYFKSQWLKRNKRHQEANTIWEEICSDPAYCLEAFEESAKFYEHTKKDFALALKAVDGAFKRLNLQKELDYQIFEEFWEERFIKRQNRLLRKLRI